MLDASFQEIRPPFKAASPWLLTVLHCPHTRARRQHSVTQYTPSWMNYIPAPFFEQSLWGNYQPRYCGGSVPRYLLVSLVSGLLFRSPHDFFTAICRPLASGYFSIVPLAVVFPELDCSRHPQAVCIRISDRTSCGFQEPLQSYTGATRGRVSTSK